MNILLLAKLSDSTLSDNVILPILASNIIEHIYVLRDTAGNDHGGLVSYHTSKIKGSGRHLAKICKGIELCRTAKINAIIGVLNTPHGYIGKAISVFTNTPYIHMTIAGHREFWVKGTFMEKVNLRIFRKSFITVTGEQTRNYLIKNDYNTDKIVVLPNLPNTQFNNVDLSSTDNDDFDIISFSRIDKNKNLPLLIKAVKRMNNPEIRVAIAGNGPELENIKNMVKENNLEGNIVFLGYVSGVDNKIAVLRRCKIFISCSKGEGFPVSLLEAMCCGCVPIVSNVGDCVDIIKTDCNGYIYNDTDDESEVTEYLKTAFNDKNKYDELKINARKIRNNISISSNGQTWNGIFKNMK